MTADQPNNSVAAKDLPAHQRNYDGFLKLLKFTALAVFLIAMVVMFLISN